MCSLIWNFSQSYSSFSNSSSSHSLNTKSILHLQTCQVSSPFGFAWSFQDPPPALVLLQPGWPRKHARQHEHHSCAKHHLQHCGPPEPTAALEQQRRCFFPWSTSDSISPVCASVPFTTGAFVTKANNYSRPHITCSTRPAAALTLSSILWWSCQYGMKQEVKTEEKNWHIWIKDRWESSGHIVKLAKLKRSEELTQQNAPEKLFHDLSVIFFFKWEQYANHSNKNKLFWKGPPDWIWIMSGD